MQHMLLIYNLYKFIFCSEWKMHSLIIIYLIPSKYFHHMGIEIFCDLFQKLLILVKILHVLAQHMLEQHILSANTFLPKYTTAFSTVIPCL